MTSFDRFDLAVRFSAVLFALLGLVAVASAQSTISTDRPSQTTPPGVIEPGVLQLEAGVQMVNDRLDSTTTRTYSLPSLSVRIGVLPTLELRLGAEHRMLSVEGFDGETSGLTGVSIGTKVAVAKEEGAMPELGLIAQLALPVGADQLRPASVAPSMTLAFRRALNDAATVNLYGNLLGSWDGTNGTGTGGYTLSLWTVPVGSLSVFAEVYGSFPPGTPPLHSADIGAALPVGNDLQFDLYGGLGLTPGAPDAFINAGLSLRLPR